jgi:hypothetical protein
MMRELMAPELRRLKKKELDPQIYGNRFIRTKYLMGCEKEYLELMDAFFRAILGFVQYACFDLEPRNCLMVKECMLDLAEAFRGCHPKPRDGNLKERVEDLTKTPCYQ